MLLKNANPTTINMSHEEYIAFVKEKIVATAKDMLTGDIGIILGSRKLYSLSYELGDQRDLDFNIFIAVDSETDHLPVDDERENWSEEALKRKDVEIAEYESCNREQVMDACRKLIQRFDYSKD